MSHYHRLNSGLGAIIKSAVRVLWKLSEDTRYHSGVFQISEQRCGFLPWGFAGAAVIGAFVVLQVTVPWVETNAELNILVQVQKISCELIKCFFRESNAEIHPVAGLFSLFCSCFFFINLTPLALNVHCSLFYSFSHTRVFERCWKNYCAVKKLNSFYQFPQVLLFLITHKCRWKIYKI